MCGNACSVRGCARMGKSKSPIVSCLFWSGLDCVSLSGHISGAAPGLVPSCIPEQLLRWGSGWEGAGMQEKGGQGLTGSGNRAELRNKCLSEFCKFLHFGKQEGHCAPCLSRSDHPWPPAHLPRGRCNTELVSISSPMDAVTGRRCWSVEEGMI